MGTACLLCHGHLPIILVLLTGDFEGRELVADNHIECLHETITVIRQQYSRCCGPGELNKERRLPEMVGANSRLRSSLPVQAKAANLAESISVSRFLSIGCLRLTRSRQRSFAVILH